MRQWSRRLTLVLSGFLLGACNGDGGDDAASVSDGGAARMAQQVEVTREACNPFGNPPRPVVPVLNDLTQNLCPGGRRLGPWRDGEGTPRHACLYNEGAASRAAPLPLVIWLHPSAVTADMSLLANDILARMTTADLTGDPQRQGFVLLAPGGRSTNHFYPFPDDNAPGWDNWYRQLAPDGGPRTVNGEQFPQNVDAATIDHFVDRVVANANIDTDRIYVMGWSNGSAMAALYSLNRPFVASAAIYSSPNPFEAFNDPCSQQPVAQAPADDTELQVFHPDVPIFHVHNDCDIGGICPNSLLLRDQARAVGSDFENVTIDSALQETGQCLAICGTSETGDHGDLEDPSGYQNLAGYTIGVVNHLRWPVTWTESMFGFLREHPRD